jgi:6-phosphogluconolactonase/glucosamine-6-phosphate isomerase/deaminase
MTATHLNLVNSTPDTRYFKTKEQFDEAVGKDFILYANKILEKNNKLFVGLSHGQSPAGAYNYIYNNYNKIKNKHNIYFSFVNTPLKSQEKLVDVFHAGPFLKKLLRDGLITRSQVIGSSFDEDNLEAYLTTFNTSITNFLYENNKTGFDYAFLACNPRGRIAGIERKSKAFESKEITTIVTLNKEKEITTTPYFLSQTKRIAFLATKADKRRPLAWLYSNNGLPNESPSFVRFIPDVKNRVTVFIDDEALTWPQIQIKRETPYGQTTIRLDLTYPYKENAKEKLPVIILIHGFLGLNSFDGLLTTLPTSKYIAAAMHYGTIPNDLPIDDYSKHVMLNINAVVEYFGERGHPVYILDHSMGNIYFLMMDKNLDSLPNIKKYLKGRIGANPFFGEEAKHALLGFLDNVIIPSMNLLDSLVQKPMLMALRQIIPFDSRKGVRNRGIGLAEMLIGKNESEKSNLWKAVKRRVIEVMSELDSLPQLNRIPIENALNKVPPKIFAIQSRSALKESKAFDKQVGLTNIPKYNIPVLILQSQKDGVAKYVHRIYQGDGIKVFDITNAGETDLFREHLYHMADPIKTAKIIDEFIIETEAKRKK